MVNIIFLDIDGVINSGVNEEMHRKQGKSVSSYHITLPQNQLKNLKEIMDMVPNTRIVLSSSWRMGGWNGIEIQNLTKQLDQYGMRIFDFTPNCNNGVRGLDISTYLKNFERMYGYNPPYIIIDDEIKDIVPYHRGHIIRCDRYTGLTENEVNISISLLKKFKNLQNK